MGPVKFGLARKTEADLLQCPDCFPFSHVPPAYYNLSPVKFTRRLELKLGYCIENQWVQSTILISTDDGIKAK